MRGALWSVIVLLTLSTSGMAKAADCDPHNEHLFAMIGCGDAWERQIGQREQTLTQLDSEYDSLEQQNADLKWRVREEKRIVDGLKADVAQTTEVLRQLRSVEGNNRNLLVTLQRAEAQAGLLQKDIALAQRVRDDLARHGANPDPDGKLDFDWAKLRHLIGQIRDIYGLVKDGYDAAKYFDLIGPETLEILEEIFGVAEDVDGALGGLELAIGFFL